MKKIMTIAIMAFLFGGLCFNANAQDKKAQDAEKKEVVTGKKQAIKNKTDWNKVLKEYEETVDKCVNLFNQLSKTESTSKNLTKQFNETLEKAENLKGKLETAKEDLNRSQIDRLIKANNKLLQVYAKG